MPVESQPTTAALSIAGVTRTFDAGDSAVRALRGIDLSIESGAFTAVMGPSGSGKSTLLNCIAGLESVTAGNIVIEGHDISTWSENRRTKFRRSRLGMVFQGFHLIPYLTAEQNVALPLRLAGRRPDRGHVQSMLAAVGLEDRGVHLPAELSGGQQQRVAIARALVTDPAVLLADEPTGALDSATARSALELVRDSVDRADQAVLMVTHDPVAAAYADNVVFLVDGRIAGQMHNPAAEAVAGQLAHLEGLVTSQVPT
ncbi:MAG: ABC transporter ATP-binding protein [Tomitella sp.]|nr:ABC transporter ATP-binding protein [Tomitella sp.]